MKWMVCMRLLWRNYFRMNNNKTVQRHTMKDNKIIILKADISDIEPVANLFDAYREFYGKSKDIALSIQFINDRMNSNESSILLAKIKGEYVGFTQLYPFFSSVRATRLMVLNDLFVYPEYRGKGVAKRLIESAVELAKSEGCGGLILETTEDNIHAQSLYEKLGWAEESGIKHYSFDLN